MGKKRRRKNKSTAAAAAAASAGVVDGGASATTEVPNTTSSAPKDELATAASAAAAAATAATAAAPAPAAQADVPPQAKSSDTAKRSRSSNGSAGGGGGGGAGAGNVASTTHSDPVAAAEAERVANQRKLQKMVIRMRQRGRSEKEIRKAKIAFKREVNMKKRIANPATTPRETPKAKKLTKREQHVAEWKARNPSEAQVKGQKHNLVIVPVLWRHKEEESADILAACATIKKYLSSFGLDVWIDERTKCVNSLSGGGGGGCGGDGGDEYAAVAVVVVALWWWGEWLWSKVFPWCCFFQPTGTRQLIHGCLMTA